MKMLKPIERTHIKINFPECYHHFMYDEVNECYLCSAMLACIAKTKINKGELIL
jgi:hypothetical protein